MALNPTQQEISNRRTFAIISHPDAGKTTLTEKLLHLGGAIQQAGTVKARKSGRHATSDWMELEKQRGISVTSSVMQFDHHDKIVNLLDTPGHADFSEDTYRTLTAVDSALMVIDSAKGVEERTIKLMDVCRLRDTPIMSFVNKMDRDGREPLELIDEIEDILKIKCAPMTWPIGSGKSFVGIYRLFDDKVRIFSKNEDDEDKIIDGISNPELDNLIDSSLLDNLKDDIELVKMASHPFELEQYLKGDLSPVYFGSALNSLGVYELMDQFVDYAPMPLARVAEMKEETSREVKPLEDKLTGFVFKIQANMDPNHHDRIAFMRITSGKFNKGMKLKHVRANRDMAIHNAITFMAAKRENAEQAFAGDILGLHNHGSIQIGDTFTEGEELKFIGIPFFAPELFRRVRLKDPLKAKALQKGLIQLSEEGATQVFRPILNNDLILGAVGILQFDVVAHRLQNEYNVECQFESVPVSSARWISFPDSKTEQEFMRKNEANLAYDGADFLTYIAPNNVNLQLAQERFPSVTFAKTREL